MVHPCDEMWPAQFGPRADCFEQLHPQPWLNLRWMPEDSPMERSRVSCPLYDGSGTQKPLVLRLQNKGAMQLNCQELAVMAREHGLWSTRSPSHSASTTRHDEL